MAEKLPENTIEKLFNEVRSIITEARNTVYKTANFEMVKAYWHIGKLIVEEEQNGKQRAEYGSSLIKELSKRLTSEFGRSFSDRNLRHIRHFILFFRIGTQCVPN